MPFVLIRQNITAIECDAVVNPTNEELAPGGGIDSLIHRKAGKALTDACRQIGSVKQGQAAVTPAFGLAAKYVIHTAGPVWHGGNHGEEAILRSCYRESLSLAEKNGCETVAIPLISSGSYGYPKDKVLSVALDEVGKFLLTSDMTVFIVLFDKESYEISGKLFGEIKEYISDNYAEEVFFEAEEASDAEYEPPKRKKLFGARRFAAKPQKNGYVLSDSMAMGSAPCHVHAEARGDDSLENMIHNMDESFSLKLLRLIDAKGLNEVECYKKANVSKQTWFKIMNDAAYHPSKNTVISFSIALELTLDETKTLLATVGYTLSKSSKFDIIIEYFISHGRYDIFEIDETLFKFDQVTLSPYN